MNMAGRRAFITGASSGIGRGTARAFAAAGAKVALSARSADKLEALCEEIRGAGGDAERSLARSSLPPGASAASTRSSTAPG